ncbi:MAG TPA: LD-carboxypeptidase [Candidatus Polarisedimenticolia bacterium]|nr:LD-carboxypeptidase [Candidatus Polarisedimenticolia bacterium]
MCLPPPLKPGARLGVVAPAGPIRAAQLRAGLAYLKERGYRVVEGSHLRDRRGYLAGTDAGRAADLNRAMADRSLDAVVFARGGYGSARFLDRLDFSPLRRRPKLFLGYSDITAFYAALQQSTGIPGFYGPMVLNFNAPGREFHEGSLWRVLERRPGWTRFRFSRRGVVRGGVASGRLIGGCLSLLVSLVGTKYDIDTRGAILFWEEVDEEPYKIDRMLNHLRMAGKLARLRGMIVGKLHRCGPRPGTRALSLQEILKDHLAGTSFPVVTGFPAGHAPGKVTLPLGLPARLDTAAGDLRLLVPPGIRE